MLDIDFGGVSFPGPAPLTQQCHDAALARHTRLSHRSLSRRRRGMAARVLLRAQSLTWCLRAALRAGGQGNGFLIYTALVSCVRVASNWKAVVAIHCTWCRFGFCTAIAHQGFCLRFQCWWGRQWLTSVCAGLAIWHYHSVFCTAGSPFCVLLRGCSEEHKRRNVFPRKKNLIIW